MVVTDDFENMMIEKITEDFTKYYLLKMGLLKMNASQARTD